MISTANVISPSPPSWIRNNSTIWPNSVRPLPTSNTTSPVTVTAEVAVKIASDQLSGMFCDTGNISSAAPIRIAQA